MARFRINRYWVVSIVFVVILLFVGKQSVVSAFRRGYKIYQSRQQLEMRQVEIEQCRRDIQALQNTDSLERYAREHYYMHADSEDVYLVAE